MREAGISRAQVAEELGVSIDTVDNWCRGKSSMRLNHFSALIAYLRDSGIEPDRLERFALALLSDDWPRSAAEPAPDGFEAVRGGVTFFVRANALVRTARLTQRGVRDFLAQFSIGLMTISGDRDVPGIGTTIASAVKDLRPKGIAVAGFLDTGIGQSLLDTARDEGTPVVTMHGSPRPDERVAATIGIDDYAIGFQAGRYFLQEGRTRIGFVAELYENEFSGRRIRNEERLRGMEAVLGTKDEASRIDLQLIGPEVPKDDSLLHLTDDLNGWTTTAASVVRAVQRGRLDAVFCSSEVGALALYGQLRQLGAEVSNHDWSLVAVTTSPWPESLGERSFPYLQLPLYDMGREAARLLSIATLRGEESLPVKNLQLHCSLKIPRHGPSSPGLVIS